MKSNKKVIVACVAAFIVLSAASAVCVYKFVGGFFQKEIVRVFDGEPTFVGYNGEGRFQPPNNPSYSYECYPDSGLSNGDVVQLKASSPNYNLTITYIVKGLIE